MAFGNKIQDIKAVECYMVSGVLSFATLDASDNVVSGYEPVGNIEGLSFEPSTTKVSKNETMSGKNNKVIEIVTATDVALSIDFSEFSAGNIERFTFGTKADIAAAAAQLVEINAKLDTINPVGFIMDSATAVVVTDDGATVTYEEGKNYEVQDSDIFIYSTAEQTAKGAANLIAADAIIEITSDKKAQTEIKAFTNTELKVAARFTGVNTANEDEAIIIELPKITLEPAAFNALSNTEFNSASVSGSILKAVGKDYLFKVLKG